MKVEKFDFRRLYVAWDDALIGKKCLISDSLDEIFEAVENGMDESDSEILIKGQTGDIPFWSAKNDNYFYYAYVLDEDFVKEPEKPLAQVRWFREDIRNSIARNIDRDVTDDDIDAVINDVDWEALEGVMIVHGLVVIDTAVAEYLRGLE